MTGFTYSIPNSNILSSFCTKAAGQVIISFCIASYRTPLYIIPITLPCGYATHSMWMEFHFVKLTMSTMIRLQYKYTDTTQNVALHHTDMNGNS